jgi:hypothetical protein
MPKVNTLLRSGFEGLSIKELNIRINEVLQDSYLNDSYPDVKHFILSKLYLLIDRKTQ